MDLSRVEKRYRRVGAAKEERQLRPSEDHGIDTLPLSHPVHDPDQFRPCLGNERPITSCVSALACKKLTDSADT